MKCPNDQTEMEKGLFDSAHWVSGEMSVLGGVAGLGRKTKFATTWRCPKCGKLEFYTETETK